MHTCRPVDLEFLDTAPHRYAAEEIVRATPARIFEVFEDAHAWTVWALPIQRVEWTSPKPYGIGTTRTVSMLGGMTVAERFIAWEAGKRMAFHVTASNLGALTAFAEDYQVTDLGNDRCRVRWVMAIETKGPGAIGLRLFGGALSLGVRFMLKRFRAYVEA